MDKFISVADLQSSKRTLSESIDKYAEKALKLKAKPLKFNHVGIGKRMGVLFLNPSLRTRISTQVAAHNLGMEPIVFNVTDEGWNWEMENGAIMNGTSVEHIKDAAPVLGQFFDILALRTFPGLKNREEDYSEKILNAFIQHCGVPVISLESATLHPLQSFADIITIKEQITSQKKFNHRPKIVLTWAPHIKALPQCVANSFAQWVTAWDAADFVITHPPGYELAEEYTVGARITPDQEAALENADFIYVKNWSSYHQYGQMLSNDPSWMLTNAHLANTNNAKVMHCLPVRRNIELSDEILDGPNSIVTQQAGNRVWSAQTIIHSILKA